jgi:hypothetical protein
MPPLQVFAVFVVVDTVFVLTVMLWLVVKR